MTFKEAKADLEESISDWNEKNDQKMKIIDVGLGSETSAITESNTKSWTHGITPITTVLGVTKTEAGTIHSGKRESEILRK